MTVQTNAFGTYQAIGNREDLSNDITRISPTKTPFQMLAGKGKATGKNHEWQTDALATAVTTNAQLEGDVIVGHNTFENRTARPDEAVAADMGGANHP